MAVTPTPTEQRLYPIPDVQRILGDVSRTTVTEMITSGRLGSVKLGSRRLVPAAALDALIAQLEEESS